jgi:hypothetical protein
VTARDQFSQSTKTKIGSEAGWLCARPGCQAATIGAKRGDPDGVLILGEYAHISAAAPGDKRFDASLTPEQRSHPSNGIWLCRPCARAIDSDEKEFPADKLRDWKALARERLWQTARTGLWRGVNLSWQD